MKVTDCQNNFRVSAVDMSDSISKVGNTARLAGIDIAELNALTAAMVSSTGLSGSEIGTA